MRHMSGLRNMKRRMKTCSSDAKTSSKASTGRRRETPNRKRHKLDETDPKSCSHDPKSCSHNPGIPPSDKPSRISCECQRAPNRTRCTASPLPQEDQEGKENEERRRSGCRVSCLLESGEDEEVGGGVDDHVGGGGTQSIFPDDDSNQILPVEQFFGNLDAMQDGLQTAASETGASLQAPRGENHHHHQQRRRRHYFARKDSEEEEEEEEEEQLSDGDMQLSHPGDS